MGWQWECVGHENTVKTREIGGMNFHLKERSRLGPTKLSIVLCAEWGHRGGMPTTARRMTLPLITNNQLNCWFDFFDSILLIPGLGWRQDNGNWSNQESKFDFVATRQMSCEN